MDVWRTGKVIRLNPRSGATYIRLDIVDPEKRPSYFELKVGNKNYNALYSLALAAAANRWPLTIRTVKDIVKEKMAEVDYMVVDWDASQDTAD